MVTNPPYGERLGGAASANEGLAGLMKELHGRGWGLFALSGDATFEDQVGRTRSWISGCGSGGRGGGVFARALCMPASRAQQVTLQPRLVFNKA